MGSLQKLDIRAAVNSENVKNMELSEQWRGNIQHLTLSNQIENLSVGVPGRCGSVENPTAHRFRHNTVQVETFEEIFKNL